MDAVEIMGGDRMKARSSVYLIKTMHVTMIYSGFAIWWYDDGHEFKFGAVL
ncbi:unnamed protein product [marine sediment metagenome]|uniref:Uncharacterized protein n=1 Tax=marine sediment metagenome TaxID=412755 RepID=X1SR22_9ZZZZ